MGRGIARARQVGEAGPSWPLLLPWLSRSVSMLPPGRTLHASSPQWCRVVVVCVSPLLRFLSSCFVLLSPLLALSLSLLVFLHVCMLLVAIRFRVQGFWV